MTLSPVDKPPPPRDLEHAELLQLYDASVHDLAFFKQQQWTTSYYAILLMAALVSLTTLLREPLWTLELVLLLLVAFAILAVAISTLRKHENAISVRRSRLRYVRQRLTDEFRRAWMAEHKEDEKPISILFVLQASLVAAFLLVCWVLVRQSVT